MSRHGVRWVKQGETEEREEQPGSPLGHHFSKINVCRRSEYPREDLGLKSSATTPSVHSRDKRTRRATNRLRNVKKHLEPATFESDRRRHVAGLGSSAVWRDRRLECFLNLAEEVGGKLKSIHCSRAKCSRNTRWSTGLARTLQQVQSHSRQHEYRDS
ncbi:hypothetical protein DPEC_G00251850 [Dallia pectoralis]|uniref:Uncharacterized protein n=1 Tax=Dallia pectoralis TaxID=75939 RepID=A0ACC2FTQ2_DALPE|nr:hypothetical protein DPEC_G00251850 [Dallia pectoralis]